MTQPTLFDEPKPTRHPATVDVERMAILAEIRQATSNGYAVSGARLAEISGDWKRDVDAMIAEGCGIKLRQVGCGWLAAMNNELLK